MSSDATFVDLEHCQNLDDECFEAILQHLKRVKVMLLKGTPIKEKSDVVMSANVGRKWDVDFIFTDITPLQMAAFPKDGVW